MTIPAESRGALRASWDATVGTAIALQWAVVLGLAGVGSFWGGWKIAVSLLLGGAAVALPNSLLAAWLTLRVYRVGAVGAVGMMAGELAKLCFTIALLVLIVTRLKSDVSWLGLVVGVVFALKAQWLALWVTRRY